MATRVAIQGSRRLALERDGSPHHVRITNSLFNTVQYSMAVIRSNIGL